MREPRSLVPLREYLRSLLLKSSVGTEATVNSQTIPTREAYSTYGTVIGAGGFGGILNISPYDSESSKTFQATLDQYQGGNLVWPRGANESPTCSTRKNVLLVPTYSLRKARACITSLYKDHHMKEEPASNFSEEWSLWKSYFPEALICRVSDWLLILP
jgi:hypothetical protein